MAASVRFLSEAQAEAAFPSVAETVELVEASLRASASGTTEVPAKLGFNPTGRSGFFHWMPFIDREEPTVGLKWVSYVPDNAVRGLVDSHAMVLLFDGDTGYPAGMMGGMGITALRTAAGALLSAKHFCSAPPRRLALVGCGRIQRMTLRFFMEAYPGIEEVAVHSRTAESREAFCAEFAPLHGRRFEPCDTPAKALADAGIVVSCVPQAAEPMLRAEDFKADALFVPLDVVAAWDRSVFDKSSLVLTDNLAQFKHHAMTRRNLALDFGRVVSFGDVLCSEAAPPQGGLVTSIVTGTSETDLFVARFVLARARVLGIGTEFEV